MQSVCFIFLKSLLLVSIHDIRCFQQSGGVSIVYCECSSYQNCIIFCHAKILIKTTSHQHIQNSNCENRLQNCGFEKDHNDNMSKLISAVHGACARYTYASLNYHWDSYIKNLDVTAVLDFNTFKSM